MRAVVQEGYGPPEVLRVDTREKPVPGPGQLLVRVCASTVSPAECAFRAGRPVVTRLFQGLRRPRHVPGGDLAGVVEQVGPGVRRFAPGDHVLGSTGPRFGAHAEYVCLQEDAVLTHSPAGFAHAEAAALVDGSLTAWTFLAEVANVRPGQRVLVNGASGSVGAAGVQVARHLGAVVTGACSTRNLDLVRGLGADAVIDYTQRDPAVGPAAYDVVFDAVGKGTFRRFRQVLARDGTYLTTAPLFGILLDMGATSLVRRRRARLVLAGLRQSVEALETIVGLAQAGELRPVLDREYPLARIVEAHQYVETGRKRGSVVVRPG